MDKKKIKIGSYYYVQYKCHERTRNYSGPVLVKEFVSSENGWSCIIGAGLPNKYVNYYSGSLFFEKDFVAKSNKEEFLLSRIQFLNEKTRKTQKELEKLTMNRLP